MIDIPASLIERIKDRQAVLVTGLGCSRLAGLPGWDDLAERMMAWMDDEEGTSQVRARVRALLGAGRRPAAIAYLRSKLPDDVIAELIKETYPPGQKAPEPIVALAKVPWRAVLTTAFDDLWDGALQADADNPTRVFLPRDAEAMEQHRGRFLLHLLGSAAAPEALCLSPADLRQRLTPTGVIDLLDDLHEKRSFVFLGFEPGDPDLRMVAERLLGANVNHVEHYFLYPGEAGLEADVVRAELGMTAVPWTGALDEAMRALGDAWAAVAAASHPPENDIDAWLAIWLREPADPESGAILRRAEERLRAGEQWDELVDLLLARVEQLPDRREQVAMLREIGRIFEQRLETPDRAFAALATAFGLDAEDAGLLTDLLRVTGKAGRWRDLVGDYTEMAKGLSDPAVRARHGLEIGRIYAEELNDVENAIAEYRRVLAIEPRLAAVPGAVGPAGSSQTPALRALCDLLAKHERWQELVPVLAGAAERETDPTSEIQLRLRIAELQESRLDNLDAALRGYELVREMEPGLAEARDALERLYRKGERWPELGRLLDDKELRATDPIETAKIRKERADLLERTGDIDGAITVLEALVANDGANRSALRSLERLYERQGREPDYLRTIERLGETAEDPGERLMLLRRLAAEWDERPDGVDRAAEALEQILQIDARDDDAFRALGRVYRQAQRWVPLAEAMRRKIEVTEDPAGRRALHSALGKLYDEELREPERALEAYASAEALGDQREATLEALARLYGQRELWRPAADTLDHWARVATDPAVRTAALFRAAALCADKLDDRRAAEERYVRVLEIDPAHAEALEALAALYRGQGDYLRSAKLLLELAGTTTNRIQRVRLLYEAGVLHQEPLNDEARAVELYAAALAADPEHVGAAERLVPIYTRQERWADLEPALDLLARKSDQRGDAEAGDIFARLAFTAQKLGHTDKALRNFEAARDLAPASMPVLAGFAELRLERREWSEAAALYEALLSSHGEALPAAELLDIHLKLARCRTELGHVAAALASYENASAHGTLPRPALEAIAALHAQGGDFVALVLAKRALLAGADDATKAQLYEETGDIYQQNLRSSPQAVASYQAALAVQPNRRQTLQKLLDLVTAGKQWAQAADTLVRIAELEQEPAVRAKYIYSAALIRRDELEDSDGAVALLNWALDDEPSMVRAFEAIERILTDAANWRELARSYRKMIKRLPAEQEGDGLTELRLRLWNSLGEVAQGKLGDLELATTAFEVACTLDPDSPRRREALAELYIQAGPDKIDKAIGQHQMLLARNPDRLASYRALAKLYRDAGATDKLWCVAATLSFLRKADADLQQLYESHKPPEMRPAKRPFNEEIWEKVIHPQEDPFVAAVFMLLGHFVAATAAQQHQAVGLRRKDRVDLAQDTRLAARALRYVSQTLVLPAPDVFYREADAQGLSMLNLQEKGVLTPAFVIGQGIVQRTSEPEVIFEIGKTMAFLRPERFLRHAAASPAALDIALRSALALGGAGVGPGEHNGEVDKLTDQLRRMVPRPVAEQMSVVGKKLVSAHGEVINMHDWIAATDLTAARVGFVLSNELSAAARVISAEPAAQSPLGAKQRLKDLLTYSVSEDYFAVRKFLGVEVG